MTDTNPNIAGPKPLTLTCRCGAKNERTLPYGLNPVDWCEVCGMLFGDGDKPPRYMPGFPLSGVTSDALTRSLAGREPSVEMERAAVVAWLQEQSDQGAEIGIAKEKGSTARAAFGGGSYALKRAADEIEQGAHVGAEPEIICEGCGKPVLRGQFVHCYTDVGEVHVDCERPNALSGDPEAVVLLGEPLRRTALASPRTGRSASPPEGDRP